MINYNLNTKNISYEIYKKNFKATNPNFCGSDNKTVDTNSDNRNLYYAVGGILVGAGTAGIIALCSRGRYRKEISGLNRTLGELRTQVSDEITKKNSIKKTLDKFTTETESNLAKKEAEIKKLQEQLDTLFEANPTLTTQKLDEATAKYRRIAQEAKLDYNPMKPIVNGKSLERQSRYEYIDFIKINSPMGNVVYDNFPTQLFFNSIKKLQEGQSFSIPFVETSPKIKITKMQNACLNSASKAKLEQNIEADMLVTAGETAQWSKEKIARDLLQNFYDGHGQTLDGVKFVVTKTNRGYRVRIAGKSTFDEEKIVYIGNTTKRENPYEAGGFGEGLKMVNASMFGKKIIKNIEYGSADWMYNISANNDGHIFRKLSQVGYFDGNFVEFETKDEEFVQKLVEATKYFEHSKNTDFKNTIYQNTDMGINFLGKNKKGNFYLTQRFAYGDENGWEQNLEGLTLFFRKKPSVNIGTGRDRRFINREDLEKIIGSFVEDISYDDALQIIMKMQSVWEVESKVKPKAYKILLERLCKKFAYSIASNKKIDLTQQKFVACESYELSNLQLMERLAQYGYTPCEDYFEHIGMPRVEEVLSQYSAHNPLKPTEIEIKKMRLLGEAAKIVSDVYKTDELIVERLSNIFSNGLTSVVRKDTKFTEQIFQNLLEPKTLKNIIPQGEFNQLVQKYEEKLKPYGGDPDNAPEELKEQIYSELKLIFDNMLNKLVKNIKTYSPEQQDEIISILKCLSEKNYLNKNVAEILNVFTEKMPIIKEHNPLSPVYIFDRTAEKCDETLAEAMISDGEYKGHWVSRDHLEKGSFSELLATWLHEMCHQYAGDGDKRFGYKLTDLLGDTFTIKPQQRMELSAIRKAFEELNINKNS